MRVTLLLLVSQNLCQDLILGSSGGRGSGRPLYREIPVGFSHPLEVHNAD
jgi:hypothetical protein